MKRAEILDKAKQCVCGQREKEYGSPEDNFLTIAKLWSAYKNVDFSANDVAMMMALLKIARIRTGTATEDSFVDLAGYAACGAEIVSNERGMFNYEKELVKTVSSSFNKMGFQLKKHSPEILVVAGIVGTVVSTVMACKATTKVSEILEDSKNIIDSIHDCQTNEALADHYTPEDAKKI